MCSILNNHAQLYAICTVVLQIVGEGPMTNRSSTAVLSPVELTALRRVADGRTKDVKADH